MTSSIYSAAATLVLVMDPIGNVPIFVTLLKFVDPERRRRIIIRESLIALTILVLFLFAGRWVLEGLGVTSPALSITGGIILFLISLKMIFPPETNIDTVKQRGEPFIVPLAIPLFAGPSSMATVMLFASHSPNHMADWFFALLVAWLISALILLLSTRMSDWLGEKGLTALERLMGILLTTIAIQMFLSGVKTFFMPG